jgi:hypothetical protein
LLIICKCTRLSLDQLRQTGARKHIQKKNK